MEKFKELLPWIACLLLNLLMTAFFWWFGYSYGKKKTLKELKSEKVETKVITDKYVAPKPIKEVSIGSVSIPFAVYPKQLKQKIGNDTCSNLASVGAKDSLRVTIPITQKTFADSNYTAYVSGYMPNLDSIEVRNRVMTYTKCMTNTKFRKWNIGITGGYGYGFTSHKVEPFLGLGITFNFFR